MGDLHEQMMAAHAAKDIPTLVRLYTHAADQARTADEEGFFLTHAYVFALESNSPQAAHLHARLKLSGREE